MVEAKKAPSDLSAAGAALWTSITSKYELRADELRVLEDVCREADLVDAMDTAVRGADLMTVGSQGQPVINPLVSELRQHRQTLAGLLRQLKLPDDGEAIEDRSTAARAAANARWATRGA